jgi:hypothetical protein
MRFIITEEQYDRIIDTQSRNWVRRNYDLVKQELDETFDFTSDMICRVDNYEDFEYRFFSVLMDGLHPHFYDIEGFDYNGVFNMLIDLFYVDCTEFYFSGREKC